MPPFVPTPLSLAVEVVAATVVAATVVAVVVVARSLRRAVAVTSSKYCVYALDKSHKDCPQGKDCKRIWQNVPFSKLDAEAVRTRVEGIRSHFTSLSKRKADKSDKGDKDKKKVKKQDEED